jgi:hypothetical protein
VSAEGCIEHRAERRPKGATHRAVAFCDLSGVRLHSRQQRWLTDSFPDITTTLITLADEQVVLDGEPVVWRDGRFDFAASAVAPCRRVATPSQHSRHRSSVAIRSSGDSVDGVASKSGTG